MPGTYFITIYLNDYGVQNPFTVLSTGLVSVANGDGLVGTGSYQWTVVNRGSVLSTGGSGVGIDLGSGVGGWSRTGRAGHRAG